MNKPKLGLALGAGAARGWAHFGVIDALEEQGIKPDIICGTSVGAMVGAAYSLGHHEDFREWTKSLSRKDVLALMDFRFNGGIVAGERLMKFFKTKIGDPDFSDCEIPFACIATDLAYGSEYWLKEGKVLDAVRASIALPGLFAPYKKEGRWLADGGMVNPVPVSLCRALGADLVLAVDLNADLLDGFEPVDTSQKENKEKDDGGDRPAWKNRFLRWADDIGEMLGMGNDEPSMMEVVSRSINIMSVRITRSRMAGDPPRIVFEPRLSDINTMDFHLAEQAIEEGRRSVESEGDALDELKRRLSIDK